MNYTFAAVIVQEGEFYVAHCPELGVTSQGKLLDGALANLKEAVHLFLSDADAETVPHFKEHPLVTAIEVAV